MPEDLNPLTKSSVKALAGSGLIGVAKDTLPKGGEVGTFAAGFIEIELDTETGKYQILDYVGVTDCGTVIHPSGLETQVKSGAVQASASRSAWSTTRRTACRRTSVTTRRSRRATRTSHCRCAPAR